ncbi:HAD-IA family hydrolase [Dellaglioa sp. P0083]|uniref:HAD-IA family hydrolase n=1 Tax=Dellaglioa kimchii TaxID=3344667 RepID=UPI0038D430B8
MINNYFWDFDGTLFDTYPEMVKAFQEALRLQNVIATRTEIYKIMREKSVRQAIQIYQETNLNLDVEQLRVSYDDLERQSQKNTKLFPGAKEVCKWVVDNGGQNFLLTHRDQSAIDMLRETHIIHLFSDFVTSDQKFPRKPNPASLNYLVEKNAVDYQKAAMIGDRELDIAAGHNAGMKGYLFDFDQMISTVEKPDKRVLKLIDLIQK